MNKTKVFSIACIIIPTMVFGFRGEPTEMGIALVMGALSAAFLNLDSFESFKGAGFEARLKKANEAVEKALVTIEKLNKVIEPLLVNTVVIMTNMGKFNGGGSTKEKIDICTNCKNISDELGIESTRLKKQINKSYLEFGWDLYNNIYQTLKQTYTYKTMKIADNYNKDSNFPKIQLKDYEELRTNDTIYKKLENQIKEYNDYLEIHFQ